MNLPHASFTVDDLAYRFVNKPVYSAHPYYIEISISGVTEFTIFPIGSCRWGSKSPWAGPGGYGPQIEWDAESRSRTINGPDEAHYVLRRALEAAEAGSDEFSVGETILKYRRGRNPLELVETPAQVKIWASAVGGYDNQPNLLWGHVSTTDLWRWFHCSVAVEAIKQGKHFRGSELLEGVEKNALIFFLERERDGAGEFSAVFNVEGTILVLWEGHPSCEIGREALGGVSLSWETTAEKSPKAIEAEVLDRLRKNLSKNVPGLSSDKYASLCDAALEAMGPFGSGSQLMQVKAWLGDVLNRRDNRFSNYSWKNLVSRVVRELKKEFQTT